MTNDLAAGTWTGWFRPSRGAWRAVVQGDGEDDATAKLLRYGGLDAHAELLVLPAGRHPDDKPAPKRRSDSP
jgi:hypothetical protein